MDLTPVVTRLQQHCPALRQVSLALSGAVQTSFPSAYVLLVKELAAPNPLAGAHRQRVTAHFGVEINLKHSAAAASGGPAADALEPVRLEVLAALMGWSPAAGYAPIDWAEGALIDFEAGFAAWRDVFITDFYLEVP